VAADIVNIKSLAVIGEVFSGFKFGEVEII
jgi:hypothetical protein